MVRGHGGLQKRVETVQASSRSAQKRCSAKRHWLFSWWWQGGLWRSHHGQQTFCVLISQHVNINGRDSVSYYDILHVSQHVSSVCFSNHKLQSNRRDRNHDNLHVRQHISTNTKNSIIKHIGHRARMWEPTAEYRASHQPVGYHCIPALVCVSDRSVGGYGDDFSGQFWYELDPHHCYRYLLFVLLSSLSSGSSLYTAINPTTVRTLISNIGLGKSYPQKCR